MPRKFISTYLAFISVLGSLTMISFSPPASTSDHADTHSLRDHGRHDARIGDFYVFKAGDDRLVLALTLVGAASQEELADFHFFDDVTYRFHIDRNPPLGDTRSITEPEAIAADVIIAVQFKAEGAQLLYSVSGLHQSAGHGLRLFSGLRDDPFIRDGLEGTNVAAIVVELPLDNVTGAGDDSSVLAWSTVDVEGVAERPTGQDELGAHPYRSQMPETEVLNFYSPAMHAYILRAMGMEDTTPDVLVYDTSLPASYPNGRALIDDVVDSPLTPVSGRGSNPSANDVPFLDDFPYLSPPH